jgi:UDP-N-acetylglucosamine--N-acetylmuramyl-(pentapeptide) pyrophosphoryl-undecaprenol N-acetylglucosamine transferase
MAGGHLAQLYELAPRLPFAVDDAVWVTVDTAQSRTLLAGRDVHFARFVQPRDFVGVARNAWFARGVLREGPVSAVVSTGSSIALSFLPLAAAHRIPAYFIESAARFDGPSMSGRLLARCPGVRTYTQSPSWAGGCWRYVGSVLDQFEAAPLASPPPVRNLVVTVGTAAEGFGFRALFERLVEIVPPSCSVVWQVGSTDLTGLGIEGREGIPSDELGALQRSADAVVAHAGTGSALAALGAGKLPVLVPRRKSRRETIDDHQQQIARELDERGLAIGCEVEDLDWATIERAAGFSVTKTANAPPLDL